MSFKQDFFDIEKSDFLQDFMSDLNLSTVDKWLDGGQYISLWNDWQAGKVEPPDDNTKQELKERIVETFGKEKAETLYSEFDKQELLLNPVFVKFMLDTGASSKVYPEWRLMMPHAFNLLISWGIDIYDKRIDENDLFWRYTVLWPIFVFIRFRTHIAASYMKERAAVTILGCGKMPELTKVLMKDVPWLLPKKIIACDTDNKVAEWVKSPAIDKPIQNRLTFRQENLVDTLKALPSNSQDVIWAGGIASYAVNKLPALLLLVWTKLRRGGTMLLDLQILDWSLDCCIKVHGWEVPETKMMKFTPSKDVADAVATMEQAVKNLPYERQVYYLDPRLPEPIGAVFAITKGRFKLKMLIPLLKMLWSKLVTRH